jgi:hypothetical protein
MIRATDFECPRIIHRWPYGSFPSALVETEFVREEQESRKRKPLTQLHVRSVHTLDTLIQCIGAVAACPSICALRGWTRYDQAYIRLDCTQYFPYNSCMHQQYKPDSKHNFPVPKNPSETIVLT